jgi:hypothetical protein
MVRLIPIWTSARGAMEYKRLQKQNNSPELIKHQYLPHVRYLEYIPSMFCASALMISLGD